MSTRRRIASTAAAGVILGLATLVAEDPGFPLPGANGAIDLPVAIVAGVVLVLAPTVVSRWWVLAAMTAPLAALLIMQAADVTVSLDDGTGPALNYRTILFLSLAATLMFLFSAVGYLFADARADRGRPQSDQPG